MYDYWHLNIFLIIIQINFPKIEQKVFAHVNPISKCKLLRLIADIYGKKIEILPDKEIFMNRSLNSERFRIATGYNPPDWHSLVKIMSLYR